MTTIGMRATAPAGVALPRRAVPPWLRPGLVYVAGQGLVLLALVVMSGAWHRSLASVLTSWDGQHFLGIAAHGYTPSVSAPILDSPAFFPGYPGAVAVVSRATGQAAATAIGISVVAGVVAAYGVDRLTRLAFGMHCRPATPLIAIGLFAVAPLSVVYLMAYSEALFAAFAVWALVAVLRRRWLTAALLTVAAGTVRQTAVALSLAILIAALAHRREWRPWLAVVLSPLGVLSYLVFVDRYTGVRGGWFQSERNGWNTHLDGGLAFVRWAWIGLTTDPGLLREATVVSVVVAAVAVVALARRGPLPLVAYGAAVLALDAGTDGIMNSKVRLLLPAFVLLLPLADVLAAQSRRRSGWVFALLAAAGAWYSAYALVAVGYAI